MFCPRDNLTPPQADGAPCNDTIDSLPEFHFLCGSGLRPRSIFLRQQPSRKLRMTPSCECALSLRGRLSASGGPQSETAATRRLRRYLV
jgi:hypothetical protein